MIDTFYAAVNARVVITCREFVYAEEFVSGCRKLGTELEFIVGEENGWVSPEGNEAVYQNVGGSLSCKFHGSDSKHVRPAAEAVREEEDVRISSGCG